MNGGSWRKSVILTYAEGDTIEKIIAYNDCDNLSQLCKKIAHGKAITIPVKNVEPANNDISTALSVTNSRTIDEMCAKIARGQIAIIISKE